MLVSAFRPLVQALATCSFIEGRVIVGKIQPEKPKAKIGPKAK